MWSWLASFLSGPIISGAIDAYKAKLAAGNDRDRMAADLAGKELTLQQRELELQSQLRVAQIGKWYEPEHLFGYIMVIYFGKVILWDKVLGNITAGRTDPLGGDVATWAGMIMLFYFGKRGIENAIRLWKGK